MKESLRAIFAGDLEIDELNEMLDRWCQRASRSRLPSFIRLIKDHPNSSRRDIWLRHTQGIQRKRVGGPDACACSIIAHSSGFHSAKATLALVSKLLGPIDLKRSSERAS